MGRRPQGGDISGNKKGEEREHQGGNSTKIKRRFRGWKATDFDATEGINENQTQSAQGEHDTSGKREERSFFLFPKNAGHREVSSR